MAHLPSGRTRSLSPHQIQSLLQQGFRALTESRLDEAGACCRKILSAAPKTVEAHFLVGLIAREAKDLPVAIQAFGSVTTLDPSHAAGWAHLARTFAQVGQMKRADDALEHAIKAGTKDPMVEDLIGRVLSSFGDQANAKKWYKRAVKTNPQSVAFNMNLANSLIFLGEIDEGEAVLKHVLKMRPDQPQAHARLSSLRRAADHSHLDELNKLIDKFRTNPRALSLVAYAAGKEYEDLEKWDDAFRCFEIGAKAKREIVEFDEAEENKMFDALRETYTPEWLARKTTFHDTAAPIFIVGQPRTGTTLVERIVTSHSMVHSAGELQQFRLALWRNAHVESTGQFPTELARAAGSIDPVRIGTTYMETSASMRGNLPRFVDKMPINYLFLPLIVKALPNAKIIHLVRDPMDSCFSSFKQLFAEAYFHSYTLEEMARHHVRYYRLMEYWRELLPGRFFDIRYEDVASDLEPNARALIDYLELPWEDACLEFHRQDGAVMTASAVQVREKAHTRSIGRWRKYEKQLQPALEILRAEGVVDY